MKKYQWHSPALQRKFKHYNWSVLGFALVAIVLKMVWGEVLSFLLLALLAGAVVMFWLSWRVQKEDAKLKAGNRKRKS